MLDPESKSLYMFKCQTNKKPRVYHHLTDDIIAGGKMRYVNGGMRVPTGPGLGVELDRDKLARYHALSKQHEMGAWTDDPRRPGAVITPPKW